MNKNEAARKTERQHIPTLDIANRTKEALHTGCCDGQWTKKTNWLTRMTAGQQSWKYKEMQEIMCIRIHLRDY